MKALLNKKDVTPSCSYCAHGRLAPNKESVLCMKKGVVDIEYSCNKFRYDPLKRKPMRPRAIEKFEESDFALDDYSLEVEEE
ncbi:MAG: hypothetical protein IJ300_12585 [Clostridia bacterium]|nr:hypothetical protein [Clostridia bacterium]MBQ8767018.1 hypothetical protein [Clostridia bacterium]